MNNLLIIGHQFPEPKSSAAGNRMMQLIELFRSKDYTITFATEAAKSEWAVDLGELGITVESIRVNDSYFDEQVKVWNPSVVLFDRFMMEEQFGWRVAKSCPEAIRILDSEDLHFLRKSRHMEIKAGRSVENAPLFTDDAKREIASILRCDLTLVISKFEMSLLEERFNIPTSHLFYLPFLFDSSMITDGVKFEKRQHFVSIGNFLHAPNRDAVLHLKNSIWSEIRAKLPNAELHVYGAYGGDLINKWNKPENGFHMRGRAEDALTTLSHARVLLAPLRFGAGLKGKLFESWLTGTPSVTTRIGAEGMHDGEWSGVVADESVKFVQASVDLYQSKSSWIEANLKTKSLLEGFERQSFECRFQVVMDQLKNDLHGHREQNFIGAMLQYHTLRSTEFMSRWIEAKNRS